MKNFEYLPLDLSKWDFQDFAAFLQCADPAFVGRSDGLDEAIDEPPRSQSETITSVNAVDGLCPTSPVTPAIEPGNR